MADNLNTDYWYQRIDMDLVTTSNRAAQGIWSIAVGGEFLLTPQENKTPPQSLKNTKVMVTPAMSNRDALFYLDATTFPGNPQGGNTDVFQELLPEMNQANPSARIFFPLNIGGAHWATVDIALNKTSPDNANGIPSFNGTVTIYDPFGPSTFRNDVTEHLVDVVKYRLERNGSATAAIKAGDARTVRLQAVGDGTSCGPITADVINSLLGTGRVPTSDYPAGTETLRQNQLVVVKRNTAPELANDFKLRVLVSDEPPRPIAEDPFILLQGDQQNLQSVPVYSAVRSVIARLGQIKNHDLLIAIRMAFTNIALYSKDPFSYLGAIHSSLTLTPTTLQSVDPNALEFVETRLLMQIDGLIFSPESNLSQEDVLPTILKIGGTISEPDRPLSDLKLPDLPLGVKSVADVEPLSKTVRKKSSYPVTQNNSIKFYNDACEDAEGAAGAFPALSWAISQANSFIFIVDWSFHPDVFLTRPYLDGVNPGSVQVGQQLIERAGNGVLVAINTWKHPKTAGQDPVNDAAGAWFNTAIEGFHQQGNWTQQRAQDNLLWRASVYNDASKTGDWTHSHHQKFVALDVPGVNGTRALAVFFGGLDITKGRYDWPLHSFAIHGGTMDPNFREKFNGAYPDYYNPEFNDRADIVRQPWHDVHAQITGPSSWDFVTEFIGRWRHPNLSVVPEFADLGKTNQAAVDAVTNKGLDIMQNIMDNPAELEASPHLPAADTTVCTQVARSIRRSNWGPALTDQEFPEDYRKAVTWRDTGADFEASILNTYIESIRNAENYIYIETQFLIGSGALWNAKRPAIKNSIPTEIVDKIKQKCQRNQPFHVYIVLPFFPEGSPASGPLAGIRHFQWETVKYMMRSLADGGVAIDNYLSVFFLGRCDKARPPPVPLDRAGRVVQNQRYMIYVHSKLLIADDKLLIIGSANLNDRSLLGSADTEIVATVAHDNGPNQITAFRQRLWQEHMGATAPNGEPQSLDVSKEVRRLADYNLAQFLEGKTSNHLLRFPLSLSTKGTLQRLFNVTFGQRPDDISFGGVELITDRPSDAGAKWEMKPSKVWSAGTVLEDIYK